MNNKIYLTDEGLNEYRKEIKKYINFKKVVYKRK